MHGVLCTGLMPGKDCGGDEGRWAQQQNFGGGLLQVQGGGGVKNRGERRTGVWVKMRE